MAKEGKKPSALDRAIQTALGNGRSVGLETDPSRELHPTVWDWMTRTGDGGDHILQPASLSIQLGPEGVLATLTHRDLCVSCSVSCTHLKDVLDSLERALTSPNPPLRYWGKTEPNLRRRRNKS